MYRFIGIDKALIGLFVFNRSLWSILRNDLNLCWNFRLNIRFEIGQFREVNIGWKFVKKKKTFVQRREEIFFEKILDILSAFDLDNILIRCQGRHMERCCVQKKKKVINKNSLIV